MSDFDKFAGTDERTEPSRTKPGPFTSGSVTGMEWSAASVNISGALVAGCCGAVLGRCRSARKRGSVLFRSFPWFLPQSILGLNSGAYFFGSTVFLFTSTFPYLDRRSEGTRQGRPILAKILIQLSPCRGHRLPLGRCPRHVRFKRRLFGLCREVLLLRRLLPVRRGSYLFAHLQVDRPQSVNWPRRHACDW